MSTQLQNPPKTIVLGIETSCDETALALYGDDGLISDIIYSQIDQHAVYGGVVPELAAREHLSRIDTLLTKLLYQSNISTKDITHIAYTRGPGLIGALLVGANYAQGLAMGLKCPLIGVHHLEAHIVSPFINTSFPTKPFLTLLISGGHTQIILSNGLGNYEIIGESVDDAVGEAFDKTAKIMGLGYPGGPIIEKMAHKSQSIIPLPRPMHSSKSANMSFSGLKTATRLAFEQMPNTEQSQADISASLQEAIADVLVQKVNYAINETGVDYLVVSGGVSANQFIRSRLESSSASTIEFPSLQFCTDNAAMVAYLGYLRKDKRPSSSSVMSRWRLSDL